MAADISKTAQQCVEQLQATFHSKQMYSSFIEILTEVNVLVSDGTKAQVTWVELSLKNKG